MLTYSVSVFFRWSRGAVGGAHFGRVSRAHPGCPLHSHCMGLCHMCWTAHPASETAWEGRGTPCGPFVENGASSRRATHRREKARTWGIENQSAYRTARALLRMCSTLGAGLSGILSGFFSALPLSHAVARRGLARREPLTPPAWACGSVQSSLERLSMRILRRVRARARARTMLEPQVSPLALTAQGVVETNFRSQ